MLRLSHIFATGLLLSGLSANLSAQVLNTSSNKAKSLSYSVQVPGRGMTMEMVKNRFGGALNKIPAVGEPPITRWIYKDFTVYFESEYVIHAVVSR